MIDVGWSTGWRDEDESCDARLVIFGLEIKSNKLPSRYSVY